MIGRFRLTSALSFAPFFAAALFPFAALGQQAQTTEMIDYPIVKLQSLDKIPARTMTFEANVGSTIKFGNLFIKVQACRKSSPLEKPESAAFLQIWEIDEKEEPQWVFSGWMFASSPALSYMDHALYDVWVLDCLASKDSEAKPLPGDIKEGEGQLPESEAPAQPAIIREELKD